MSRPGAHPLHRHGAQRPFHRRVDDGHHALGARARGRQGRAGGVHIQRALVHQLVENRIRPYYLYQCDLVEGSGHFRTPVGKGLEIIEECCDVIQAANISVDFTTGQAVAEESRKAVDACPAGLATPTPAEPTPIPCLAQGTACAADGIDHRNREQDEQDDGDAEDSEVLDVDDHAAAPAGHRLATCPCAVEGAEHVDLVHVPPLLRRHLPRGALAEADPGVRDEDVHLAGLESSLADRQAQRAAEQLGVGELLARAALAVVVEHVEAPLAELLGEAVRHRAGLLPLLAQGHELHVPRRERPRPRDSLVVGELLDRGGRDPRELGLVGHQPVGHGQHLGAYRQWQLLRQCLQAPGCRVTSRFYNIYRGFHPT